MNRCAESWKRRGTLVVALALGSTRLVDAASPTVEQALKLTPVQADSAAEYDQPEPSEIPQCTMKAEKNGGQTGWVVRSPAGEILRQFVDTNNDNVVDQWSYYANGLEVYRDIDTDFDSKADEFRWLNTGGSRWGRDADKDGKIDEWKLISAEEVSAEIVASLARGDTNRFSRMLISKAEIDSLGLAAERAQALEEKVKRSLDSFQPLSDANAAKQALAADPAAEGKEKTKAAPAAHKTGGTPELSWVDFAAARPGLVPAGSLGLSRDILVYENVLAMVEADGKPAQVQIGTLVRVGDVWRAIDAPQLADAGATVADGGFFFGSPAAQPDAGQPAQPMQDKVQELLAELEKLDKAPSDGTPEEQAKIQDRRTELLTQLAESAATDTERETWLRQLADTVAVAAQSGVYPQGVARLKELFEKLRSENKTELATYVEYRYLSADYNLSLQAPNANFEQIQKGWLENLQRFVDANPKSPDTADALLQLGMAQEFAGMDEEAIKWYQRVVDEFPQSPAFKKAQGAARRLNSVGKAVPLKGKGLHGKPVDLASTAYRGKMVLIQFWATWCEPAKADMAQLKELQARFGTKGFTLIGVNLDNEAATAVNFLKAKPLPWAQIHEPGGLESPPALELGILTLPTMMLVDAQGKVINRNIHITELEKELAQRLK